VAVFRLALLLLAGGLFVACDGGPKQDDPSATATEAVTAPEPSVVLPLPTATATPNVPSGIQTGITLVDAVTKAVLDGDEEAFRGLIELREVPCTNEFGIGGPPKCRQAPGGGAPGGTPLAVFPLSVCELEWQTGETLDAFLKDVFFSRQYLLYAVVRLDFKAPLFDEPYLPTPQYGVIFSYDRPEIANRGVMVLLEADRVAYIDVLCDGAPEDFLKQHPLYSDKAELILLGPAFR
jgi:hypothetical protein